VAEKQINITLMWSLSENVTTLGPIDDDFVKEQVIDLVKHKLMEDVLNPYITGISADPLENTGSYTVTLSGEGSA
jgi:hypothetical protein